MICFPNRKHRDHVQSVSGKASRLQYGILRLQMMIALLCLVAMSVTLVYAWFHTQKSIQTVTMIHEPNALILGAGNAHEMRELELSNIDVDAEQKYKDVVFCVYSENNFPYNLQLAHTTNVGFQYAIYPAQKGIGENNYISYLGDDYSFNEEERLAGDYLNKQDEEQIAIGSGVFHQKTYAKSEGSEESYDKVQINAEPLYWKNTTPLQFPSSVDETLKVYINYYVLRISWDENVVNNKETDMVYLMAEAASSGS